MGGEKERMHTSRDGNIKVGVSEYSERHIGNKPAERIHIVDERADLDFVIWSNKAGEFSSEVDRIKYAHLNFQMNGAFPRHVKGFFAELKGVTPLQEQSKKYVRLADGGKLIKHPHKEGHQMNLGHPNDPMAHVAAEARNAPKKPPV